MEIRVHLIVRGLVQGVGFRMFVEREARRRLLTGWTCNLVDGTVEIEVQGEEDQVRELIAQARRGPSHAGVTSVTVREMALETADHPFRVIT